MVQVPQFEENVKILKEWYSMQHHLPQNIDDNYFYNFVLGTNSIERAKQKIDAYFTLRKDVIGLFNNVLPGTKIFKESSNVTGMAILPGKTPEGYRVILSQGRKLNPDHYNSGGHFLKALLLLELGMDLWPTDTSYVIIEDMKNVPMSVVKTIELKHFHGLGKLLLKGIPTKMKKFYSVNTPGYIEKTINFIRPVLPKKIQERVVIFRDDSVLKEILPISMLPSEFGGEGKSLKELDEYWTEQLELRRNWFEEKLKLVSDESKRPKEAFRSEALDFGLDGSFKKLNID